MIQDYVMGGSKFLRVGAGFDLIKLLIKLQFSLSIGADIPEQTM